MNKFIIRFLLFSGLFLFLLIGDVIKRGFKYADIIEVSLLFGVLSLTLTLMHSIIILLKGHKLNEKALLIINNSRIHAIKNPAKEKNWKPIKENHKELVYKTRPGFNAYGERIVIKKGPKNLVVSSSSLFLLPIFDLGKSLDNIKLVRTAVK